MSNIPHTTEPQNQSSPMLFVVLLLVVIAGVLAFIAFRGNGSAPGTQPPSHTPAESPSR